MALDLSSQDRRTVFLVSMLLGIVAVIAIPIGTEVMVSARESDNEALRKALADVQEARGQIRDLQARKDAIVLRYAKPAPNLATFIQEAAAKEHLEIVDATPMPDTPHKGYVERATKVHFKKAGMYAIAKFFESIEKSGNPVALTRVQIHKRMEPDSYDVEIDVSAYDRSEKKPTTAPTDKDKKP